MPNTLSVVEVQSILQSGDFDRLIGTLEDEHLECKSAPYQLDQDRQKMELAKDVSGLANADGGIILIGVQTERDPTHLGDEIRRIRGFPPGLVNIDQYQQVLAEWIYPPIRGLDVIWHPGAADAGQGTVSITVPQEASQDRPYLVGKIVEATGKTLGAYIGHFERAGSGTKPTSVEDLRSRLKDGLRFSELEGHLQNIEETLGKLTAGPAQQRPAISVETVAQRLKRARETLRYGEKPTLFLVAWPLEPAQFPTLFESRQETVVQLLENPPKLRDFGFDLSTRRASTIVEAALRRCMVVERKLLELWRDGLLVLVAPGDEWHLCWGMQSDATTGLRINNLCLAETTYLFSELALTLFAHSVPQPARLNFWLGLQSMTLHERPCSLNPYRPNQFNLDDGRQNAPEDHRTVRIEVGRDDSDAGTVSYRLLANLYAWFGFDADLMPYVNRDVGPPRIDPVQIVGRPAR